MAVVLLALARRLVAFPVCTLWRVLESVVTRLTGSLARVALKGALPLSNACSFSEEHAEHR